MNKGSLALVPLLLCGGCSLTFYGLKDVKEEKPKTTAVACVEPRPGQAPNKDQAKGAVAAAAKPGAATKPAAPKPLDLKEGSAATAAAPVEAKPPGDDQKSPDAQGAQTAQTADQGPDAHSSSVATKP